MTESTNNLAARFLANHAPKQLRNVLPNVRLCLETLPLENNFKLSLRFPKRNQPRRSRQQLDHLRNRRSTHFEERQNVVVARQIQGKATNIDWLGKGIGGENGIQKCSIFATSVSG